MSEKGWGEFPLHIEIIPKKGTPVKVTHYLKLNAPERIVVNETYECIHLKTNQLLDGLATIASPDETPVMSEYFSTQTPIDYVALEDAFINSNADLLGILQGNVNELRKQALIKTEEVLRLQRKLY